MERKKHKTKSPINNIVRWTKYIAQMVMLTWID